MAIGQVSVPLPTKANIKITGFTNTGGWGEQITITAPGAAPIVWTSNGAQDNHLVGQTKVAPLSQEGQQLNVAMAFNPGPGWKPSAVTIFAYNEPGLSGYLIGGQDGGGRPSGPAYWNTLVLVYWAEGY